MLQFNNAWRFESPGNINNDVRNEFSNIISKISRGEQNILEHFKRYFAAASGSTSSWSSSTSWAESDLYSYMEGAAENAPLFIEAFYDACEDLRGEENISVPDFPVLNNILSKYGAQYRIEPPNLEALGHETTIPSEVPVSLDQNAQEIIQKSFSEAQRLLAEDRYRPAVQELLWLLETVSTIFQGIQIEDNQVAGKYFNKIIDDLKQKKRGTALDNILAWIKTLHGFLSSPSGGGVRHGMHLKEGVATTRGEARLYCNLVISYISFLLSEYEQLKRPNDQ